MTEENAYLTVGVKLLIKTVEDKSLSYASQVLDINDKIIVISGPIEKGVLIPMHIGAELNLSYYIEDVGRYSFKGIVRRRSIKKIYLLEIERITEFQKVQLRDYYRLFSKLPVMKYFEKVADNIIEEKCISQDISGGGLKIKSNYSHKRGDIVECDIRIEKSIVSIKGKIVRVNTIDDRNYKFSYGIKFFEVDQKSQEIIVRYVFDEQRKLRKKGLI